MTEPVVIRLDLAPALTTFTPSDGESQVIGRTRVILTEDRIYVFVDGTPPRLFYEGRIDSIEGRNTTGYQVLTASGDIVNFKRGTGCGGCGSQLRSFRPFPQGMVQGAYTHT